MACYPVLDAGSHAIQGNLLRARGQSARGDISSGQVATARRGTNRISKRELLHDFAVDWFVVIQKHGEVVDVDVQDGEIVDFLLEPRNRPVPVLVADPIVGLRRCVLIMIGFLRVEPKDYMGGHLRKSGIRRLSRGLRVQWARLKGVHRFLVATTMIYD